MGKTGFTYYILIMLLVSWNTTSMEEKPCAEKLFQAIREGNKDQVSDAFSEGADIHAFDSLGDQPIHTAARFGHAELVCMLVINGARLNALTRYGKTLLDIAFSEHSRSVMTFLLERGAQFDSIGDSAAKQLEELFPELLLCAVIMHDSEGVKRALSWWQAGVIEIGADIFNQAFRFIVGQRQHDLALLFSEAQKNYGIRIDRSSTAACIINSVYARDITFFSNLYTNFENQLSKDESNVLTQPTLARLTEHALLVAIQNRDASFASSIFEVAPLEHLDFSRIKRHSNGLIAVSNNEEKKALQAIGDTLEIYSKYFEIIRTFAQELVFPANAVPSSLGISQNIQSSLL